MTTIKTEQDGVMILALEGRLDTTTAPGFQQELLETLGEGRDVELDFTRMAYVSSAGLRVLLAGQKAAKELGSRMALTNVATEIMEVFRMTGFSEILTIR